MLNEIPTFYEFCEFHYINKKSARGDLTRDMIADGYFPELSINKREILEYLLKNGACESTISAFWSAWTYYQVCIKPTNPSIVNVLKKHKSSVQKRIKQEDTIRKLRRIIKELHFMAHDRNLLISQLQDLLPTGPEGGSD